MNNLKVKIITGFRRDQSYQIDAEEAHKAYSLFLDPEARTVFSNGLAIKGDQIQEIVPDYNGTMGWNPTYQLGDDDWSEIRDKGIDRKLRDVLCLAKDVAMNGSKEDLKLPLSEVSKRLGIK